MSNELFKFKQKWIEAVMASDLSLATKVYAFGIYKHMYGTKTDAFPGAKAITEATGLSDSAFYTYNKALAEAGFMKVTHRSGKVNLYELTYSPTEWVGTPLHSGVHPPTEWVTPPHTVGTNTTKKTTRKTSMEDNNNAPVVADAPTVTSEDSLNEDIRDGGYVYLGTLTDEDFKGFKTANHLAYDYLANSDGVWSSVVAPKESEVQVDPPTESGGTSDEEYEKGEKYLEVLLKKNNVFGERRSLARRRYADDEYAPDVTGMFRAGMVLRELDLKAAVPNE